MNVKAVVSATLLALLGTGSLVLYTKRLDIEAAGGERVTVLAIAKNAKAGTVLTEDQLTTKDVPIAYMDDRTVRANDKPKVVGVRVERDLDPNQLLSWQDVDVSGYDDRKLSHVLPAGSKALMLHIPQQFMSADLLRPGDFVDVLAVVAENGRNPQSIVLLQKVVVLAVGRETVANPNQGRSRSEEQLITIAVTLQESQMVSLAAQKGPVIAVARSASDQSISENVPAVTTLPTQRENVTLRPLVANVPTASSAPTPAPKPKLPVRSQQ